MSHTLPLVMKTKYLFRKISSWEYVSESSLHLWRGWTTDHILPMFQNSSVSLPWLFFNHRTILLILLPNVWPPWVWLDCKSALCASLKDVDFIPWVLWNQRTFFFFFLVRIAAKSHLCYVRSFHAAVRTVGNNVESLKKDQ